MCLKQNRLFIPQRGMRAPHRTVLGRIFKMERKAHCFSPARSRRLHRESGGKSESGDKPGSLLLWDERVVIR